MKSSFLYPCLIVLIACLQYANTLGHDYAWDDKLVITGNTYTTKGIQGIPEIFTERVAVPNKNVYRPVTQSLFAFEYGFFRHNPMFGHFFNMLWYALTCLLVFRFIQFVFPNLHSLFVFLTTLIFTVHPLHVEVVANIKSRDEILALCFGLWAIINWVKGLETGSWKNLALGIVLFLAALLSKDNAITLLPVALLVWWFRGMAGQKALVLTFLIPAVGAAMLYWATMSTGNSAVKEVTQTYSNSLSNIFLWTPEFNKIFTTSLVNIGRYLQLFLYPHPLVHMYGYKQIDMKGWGDPATWLIVALLGFTAWFLWKNRHSKRPAVFGMLFFITTYSIYSNFVVLAPDTMADRYLFIPSLGLSLIFLEICWALGGLSWSQPEFKGARSNLATAIPVILSLAFFVRSWVGNQDWKNDTTLTKNRIQYMENNAAAQATLGLLLSKESAGAMMDDQRRTLREQARQAFLKATEIYPRFASAWILLGKMYVEEKNFPQAESAFKKAQEFEPTNAECNYCLGSLYYNLSQSGTGIPFLEKAIQLDPDMETAYTVLGYVYMQNNKTDSLESLLNNAQKRFPKNGEFDAILAAYLWRQGKADEAFRLANSAIQKSPKNALATSILAAQNRGH
jgi:tetratricopeptide (TPR) repeat protein